MESVSVRRLASWLFCGAVAAWSTGCTTTESGLVRGDTRNQIIVSVRDQKLTLIQQDHTRLTFPISTSKYGFGDRKGSYRTPLGELAVAQKVGDGAAPGAVFRSRVRTGEVVGIDAPGRDAIVTRIIALRGLENGNRDAWARGIYIHGTPEERNLGRPSSYGCIRMRSRDVITVYNAVKVGARVQIIDTTMNKAIASNIVAPPPTPKVEPAVGPAAATGVAANAAPGPKPSDAATSKVLTAAIAADRKTPGANGASDVVAVTQTAPPPAAPRTASAPATKPAANGKKEWAGSPTKLLAKANESEARAKNAKPIGAARGASSVTETTYNRESNSRDMNRSVLDSL